MIENEPLEPRDDRPAGAGAGEAGGRPGGQASDSLRAGPSPPTASLATAFRASAAGPELAAAIRPYLSGDVPREGAPSLGRSLALDDGDLVLDGRSHDLALVVDADALSQALELGVATQTGSDRLNTRFGFDRLAISAYAHDLPTRKEFLTMELVRCLSSDLRVTDVREVFFDDDPRYLELRPGLDEETHRREVAAAHAARVYAVYAIVDTIANTTLTLRARGTP
ncbi:hypothetical protein [Streptomyces sp. NBC_01235]|uniref:hypothetical protein n=1 Tax=Streptomyces sp. NBC_01235 TaxID=2903788 RepID=UPI002E11445A|nr:hypothetical protein OG289_44075 [Streptomyces sp. NBC_01235]